MRRASDASEKSIQFILAGLISGIIIKISGQTLRYRYSSYYPPTSFHITYTLIFYTTQFLQANRLNVPSTFEMYHSIAMHCQCSDHLVVDQYVDNFLLLPPLQPPPQASSRSSRHAEQNACAPTRASQSKTHLRPVAHIAQNLDSDETIGGGSSLSLCAVPYARNHA